MSLSNNNTIPNSEIVPIIGGDVFSDFPDKRFAVGVFSGERGMSDIQNPVIQGYLKLRANVYIDQTGILDESARVDGMERDEDDERSTHFVVLENVMGMAAVFACMRLIEKSLTDDSPLPIEDFFPESFRQPAPIGSIEVSRFIVRHDLPEYRMKTRSRLITTGLALAIRNGLEPIYATIEPELEKSLNSSGVKTRRISHSKIIPEYHSSNFGVEIDKTKLHLAVGGQRVVEAMTVLPGSFGYWGYVSDVDRDVVGADSVV